MAEIPVERHEKSGFPWWLIPLLLLLLLLPLIWYCSRNTAVVDNTNTNGNRNTAMVANNANAARNNGNNGVVVNNNANSTAVVFNEEQRIREANERARVAMEKIYPNGTAQQVIETLNLSSVNFAKGSATVAESDKALLKQAAEQLKKSPADTRIEIGGHTDNDGDDAANQKLSQQRAEAVRAELIKSGAPSAMLSAKGYGETQPKATNDTPEGRFENRRIEYKVATSNTTIEKVAPNSNAGK